MDLILSEANRIKQMAGQDLSDQLRLKFTELIEEGVILSFRENVNFSHKGYKYKKQYLANFILETIDNKYVVINSSSSYRHDRMKLQAYDIFGVSENADISKDIVASILLYPDSEKENSSLIKFRDLVEKKEAYSPSTHILFFYELLVFLENHKAELELKKENVIESNEKSVAESGSFYGIQGNAFEKEIVSLLNNCKNLDDYIETGQSDSSIYNDILGTVCKDFKITNEDIVSVFSTNTVVKLKNGGNAKADIILEVATRKNKYKSTISLKNTTQKSVTCHDYRADDFIRVLGVQDTKLEYYLYLFQESGSNKRLLENLDVKDSIEEFEKLLSPHAYKLTEWALKGKHDNYNLIDPENQISKYILIKNNDSIHFESFVGYIEKLFSRDFKLLYGTPFQWTYPSKNRGKRIQLKVPVLT